jgi:ElaB/YqjD/DUF883 family membrane-anchored ribosome-binding protein
MTQVVQPAGSNEKDLVDRIAEALPMEVRADYYRELRHCRSLPENDEMLRILRVMQFLTLLIHTAPSRLAAERESLNQSLAACGDALEHTIARLDTLPREVASGIGPEAIAAKINESLRQQFLQSTIPQTADALAVVAVQIKKAVAEFQQAALSINNAHHSAAAEASRATREIESSVSRSTRAAQKANTDLTSTFIHEYRWSTAMIAGVALIVGVLFTLAYDNWRYSPVISPPAAQVEIHKSKR